MFVRPPLSSFHQFPAYTAAAIRLIDNNGLDDHLGRSELDPGRETAGAVF